MMADNLKAEKIAAARKKLKQFQSKTKPEPTPVYVLTAVMDTTPNASNGTFSNNNIKHDELLSEQVSAQQQTKMHFEALDPIQFDAKSHDGIPIDHFMYFKQNPDISAAISHQILNNNVVVDQKPPSPSVQQPPISASQYFANVDLSVQSTQPLIGNLFTDHNQSLHSFETSQRQTQPNTNVNPVEVATATPIVPNLNLEQRNQELVNLLQVEKLRNHELSIKLTQQHSAIEQLNSDAERLRREDATKAGIVEQLQRELSAHVQTVNILVGEKAELNSKLQRKEQQMTEFESMNIELQGRLNASRHRVAELEKDLSTLEKSHQKFDGSRQALCTELETLQENNKQLQKMHQDAYDESAELRHQLTLKAKDIADLKNSMSELNTELEMARLRLEQLTAGDLIRTNETTTTDRQQQLQQQSDTERQIIELQNMVSELTSDRDRTQQQYQTYVQHLKKETTSLTQRIHELTKTNEKLVKREESLVDHVRDLERQFQKQISTQQRLAALREDDKPKNSTDGTATIGESASNEELIALREKLTILEKEKMDLNNLLEDHNKQKLALQQQLLESESKLAELESMLERLQIEKPDTTNILATMESDKVAASRAVAQNQELKQQLEEIQKAYVQVSNDKAELASRLQSEQHLGRDIKHRFIDIESELNAVRDKLHFKDEEMIRLTHENTELNEQLLQLSQEVDRLRHYEATNNEKTAHALQQQLQAAKQENRRLNGALKVLQSKGDSARENIALSNIDEVNDGSVKSSSTRTTSTPTAPTTTTASDNPLSNGGVENSVADSSSSCSSAHDHEHSDYDLNGSNRFTGADNSDVVSVTSTINIATNEAMDKLQDRFKRTMTEIADLTEEKQRLEHLVLQLQSETETIGEYITLYQRQRQLLKQREVEKDIQLHRIAADREEMKEKLKQLNELVEQLLIQKGFSNPKQIMDKLSVVGKSCSIGNGAIESGATNENPSISTNNIAVDTTHATMVATSEQQHQWHDHDHDDHHHQHQHHHHDEHNHGPNVQSTAHSDASTHETATKIINLLTEIKDKNLKQDYSIVPSNLQHCPCCSGKLEIV